MKTSIHILADANMYCICRNFANSICWWVKRISPHINTAKLYKTAMCCMINAQQFFSIKLTDNKFHGSTQTCVHRVHNAYLLLVYSPVICRLPHLKNSWWTIVHIKSVFKQIAYAINCCMIQMFCACLHCFGSCI